MVVAGAGCDHFAMVTVGFGCDLNVMVGVTAVAFRW